MKLVDEDEYGAYRGVNAEFLKEFVSKESNANLSKDWCITQPVQKCGQPGLFLAGGASPEKLQRARDDSFEIVACEGFSTGTHHWLIGMVRPRA